MKMEIYNTKLLGLKKMNNSSLFAIGILLISGLFCCHSDSKNSRIEWVPEHDKDIREKLEQNALKAQKADSVIIDSKQSIKGQKLKINQIRKSYLKIENTVFTASDSIFLENSTEGGEAVFYYLKDSLIKIKTINFGEMGQKRTSYYLNSGELFFVLEEYIQYNQAIYIDSADFIMNEPMNDSSFFENGSLIDQKNNQDCGAPFDPIYLKGEEKRIKKDFEFLIEKL